jgi:hypothetical protein
MPGADKTTEAKEGVLTYMRAWGGTLTSECSSTNTHPLTLQSTESSVPPTALATLITAQHFRPLQKLPMLFVPVLLFSSYLNLNGFPVDSAGVTSAWSAAYLVVARRRKQAFSSKFGARGAVRGLTLGLCAANIVSGGLAYAFGKREARDE